MPPAAPLAPAAPTAVLPKSVLLVSTRLPPITQDAAAGPRPGVKKLDWLPMAWLLLIMQLVNVTAP